MDGSIAQLHSHYRVVGENPMASGAAVRLDKVLQERLIATYEHALDHLFAGDDSVYCVRHVSAKLTLLLTPDLTDDSIAAEWGSQMATAVVRAVTTESDPANVVCFRNQASYVAHYVLALLKQEASDQWFYGSFNELSRLDPRTAINRVLLENRSHLPQIVAELQSLGELDSLISVLDPQTKAALWFRESSASSDAFQPFFTHAFNLVEEIDGWAQRTPSPETLFQLYLNTDPPLPDWSDPRSLAESVFRVLRFFFARGYLRRQSIEDSSFSSGLAELDWLDTEWIKSSLIELLAQDQPASDVPFARVISRVTPKQRELLSTVAELLTDSSFKLEHDSDPVTEAIPIFARLAACEPKWTDDTTARVMILNLLMVHAAQRESGSSLNFTERLRARDVDGALKLLPEERREQMKGACSFVARLGEPALKVVERLEGEIEDAPLTTGIQSDCAGLSLLLRTMLDVRLPSLCEASLSPAKNELSPFPMLLLSLGVRLLGSTAVTNGRLDQGLCLMAGLKEPLSLNDLRECWASSANEIVSFQNSFLEVVAGQRLIEPSVVHLFQKTFPGRRVALIAADASATVWPLARVVDSGANTGGTALNLLNTWEQATGISPSVVVGANSELHKFLNQEKVVVLENDELLSLHENGLTALKTAIAALGPPQFENPDLDITFAIVDCMLLRAWARWLRRFSSSSVKYLLESFIRRQGRILPDPHGLVIELQRGPLDVIIEMAGYLRDLENVPSLAGGRIKFRLRGT